MKTPVPEMEDPFPKPGFYKCRFDFDLIPYEIRAR